MEGLDKVTVSVLKGNVCKFIFKQIEWTYVLHRCMNTEVCKLHYFINNVVDDV